MVYISVTLSAVHPLSCGPSCLSNHAIPLLRNISGFPTVYRVKFKLQHSSQGVCLSQPIDLSKLFLTDLESWVAPTRHHSCAPAMKEY